MVDGQWLWMMLDCMNNKYTIWIYILILKKYIEFVLKPLSAPIIVMLDNASVHLTNEVKRVSKHSFMEIHYLPPYWPHLAPIEIIFGATKRRISNLKTSNPIDFTKPTGKKIIMNSLVQINTKICMNFWRKFIKEAKASIMYARDVIKELKIISNFIEERKNVTLD